MFARNEVYRVELSQDCTDVLTIIKEAAPKALLVLKCKTEKVMEMVVAMPHKLEGVPCEEEVEEVGSEKEVAYE